MSLRLSRGRAAEELGFRAGWAGKARRVRAGGDVPPTAAPLLTQGRAPSVRTPPMGGRHVPRRFTAPTPPRRCRAAARGKGRARGQQVGPLLGTAAGSKWRPDSGSPAAAERRCVVKDDPEKGFFSGVSLLLLEMKGRSLGNLGETSIDCKPPNVTRLENCNNKRLVIIYRPVSRTPVPGKIMEETVL